MALMHSNGMPVGTLIPRFELPGVDGQIYSPDSFAEAAILVIVFTCNHCPYAIASEDRLISLQHDYRDKGVQLVLINPNDPDRYPADSMVMMIARSETKKFPFPYLQDENQDVARAYDAACTPDIFVFDRERKLRYNGRIDDNWQEPHKVVRHELRIALDDLLADRDISIDITPSIGCSIKWK
jgi:peroxiredoxin